LQSTQITAAAAEANATFVYELPEAFDTVVGESGNKLSGGQVCAVLA
jgi:ABC-type multidrug transport system fused ATPase/permease subunit